MIATTTPVIVTAHTLPQLADTATLVAAANERPGRVSRARLSRTLRPASERRA